MNALQKSSLVAPAGSGVDQPLGAYCRVIVERTTRRLNLLPMFQSSGGTIDLRLRVEPHRLLRASIMAPLEHDPAAHLTILLPLKDRVPFTQRWLAYAAARRLPYRILIADGGADGTVAQTVAESKSRGLDIEYVRYPFDRTYADYYAKLADALSRVTTPFVVMADNDDLFIPDGLARAVEFLLAHPDYVACGGQCAVFWLVGPGTPAGRDLRRRVEWKCSSQFFDRRRRHRPASACASAASAPTMCSMPCTAPICCGAISRRCGTAIRVICS